MNFGILHIPTGRLFSISNNTTSMTLALSKDELELEMDLVFTYFILPFVDEETEQVEHQKLYSNLKNQLGFNYSKVQFTCSEPTLRKEPNMWLFDYIDELKYLLTNYYISKTDEYIDEDIRWCLINRIEFEAVEL